MKTNEVNLDPLVRTIATHYGFSIEWDNILDKWIIKNSERKCEFYWSNVETVSDFLDNMKEHFEEIGYESSGY